MAAMTSGENQQLVQIYQTLWLCIYSNYEIEENLCITEFLVQVLNWLNSISFELLQIIWDPLMHI